MPRTVPLVVVQTWYRERGPFEIVLASDHEADATRIPLLTRDSETYERALAIEGREARVIVEWHWSGRARELDSWQEVV